MYRLLHSLLLFSAIALSVHLASAQDKSDNAAQDPAGKGVHFNHELSWTAIRAKAKAEHKYIFMDCFTTWCGPCRYMRTTIFPQEESGNFFNPAFISVEVQLDTTAKDNDHVKSWYADAHALMIKYDVRAFPTYLIFAPDGQVLNRIVGGRETPGEFITEVKRSFDPATQYYTLVRKFQQGRRDSAFLRRLAESAMSAYDLQTGRPVFKAWLATQKNPYTLTGMHLMQYYTQSTADPGFAIFLHHPESVNTVLGAGKAQRLVTDIVLREYMPANAATEGVDWKAVQARIAAKYPALASGVVARGKVIFYSHTQDWPHFQTAIVAYMQQYGAQATPDELNSYAWAVFSHCPDMNCVADALDWSKRSFKDKPNPAYMDTYANILYKMGKTADAIAWEQKAIDLTTGNDRTELQSTLDKMKKGEKTWN